MKKLILYAVLPLLIWGCSDDDNKCCNKRPTPDDLVNPKFAVTETGNPFNGALDVYPCRTGTSIFLGNYRNDPPTPISTFGYYFVQNGKIIEGLGIPLLLPIGHYNMVYWGVIAPNEQTSSEAAVTLPQAVIGDDLSQTYVKLRKYTPRDTVYRPVYDYVFTTKEVSIGEETIGTDMQRVVPGLVFIVQNDKDSALNSQIDSVECLVGGIAEQLDLYTAAPSNLTKTVLIPLTISADRSVATNKLAMIFPSVTNPPVTVRLTLKNGTLRTYRTTLQNTLRANNKLTVTINIGTIYDSPSEGNGFEVPSWTESNEVISTGSITGAL